MIDYAVKVWRGEGREAVCDMCDISSLAELEPTPGVVLSHVCSSSFALCLLRVPLITVDLVVCLWLDLIFATVCVKYRKCDFFEK